MQQACKGYLPPILYSWIYLEPAVALHPVEAEVGDEEGGDHVPEVVVDPPLQPQLSHRGIHQGEPRPTSLPRLQVTSVPAPGLIL